MQIVDKIISNFTKNKSLYIGEKVTMSGIMLMTDIPKDRQKELVPYSLRHYMITQRVMSGCKFSDVAYMCGTSVNQIEKTYYHLNEAMMKTTAMATYVKRDGKVIPIGSQI